MVTLTETNPPEALCKPLTEAQFRIYLAIYESAKIRGFQPSQRELMEMIGASSPNGIICHLKAIEKKGWIARPPLDSRSIRFLRRPDGTLFTGFAERP